MKVAFLAAVFTSAVSVASANDDDLKKYEVQLDKALLARDFSAAIPAVQAAYEIAESRWGAANSKTGKLASDYAVVAINLNMHDKAFEMFKRCAEIMENFDKKEAANCYLMAGVTSRSVANQPKGADLELLGKAAQAAEPLAQTDSAAAEIAGNAYKSMASYLLLDAMKEFYGLTGTGEKTKRDTQAASADCEKAKLNAGLARRNYVFSGAEQSNDMADAFHVTALCNEIFEEWTGAAAAYEEAHRIHNNNYGEYHRYTREDLIGMKVSQAMASSKERELLNPLAENGWGMDCRNFTRKDSSIKLCPAEPRAKPLFRRDFRTQQRTGYVNVSYDVTETGAVENVRVTESWPSEPYDGQMLMAIAKWRFKPALDHSGRPMRVSDLEVTFKLE